MTVPRRHHYLPQMYLKNFCDGKQRLWTGVLGKSEPFSTKTASIALEKDLYASNTSNGDKSVKAETELLAKCIEGEAAESYRKLASLAPLTLDDKRLLSFFFGYLGSRVPARRDQIENMAMQMAQLTLKKLREFGLERIDEDGLTTEELEEFIETGGTSSKPKNSDFIANLVSTGNELSMRFLDLQWQILIAPDRSGFITSDVPVLHTAAIDPAARPDINFFDLPDAALLVPISTQLALRCTLGTADYRSYEQVDVSSSYVRDCNRLISSKATRLIVGRDEALVKRMMSFMRQQPKYGECESGINASGNFRNSSMRQTTLENVVAKLVQNRAEPKSDS